MRVKCFMLILCLAAIHNISGQTITINSVTTTRQLFGDTGYTLDGVWMADMRLKLLNTTNFGTGGTYTKAIAINDAFPTAGSLNAASALSPFDFFFFGSFNKIDTSLKQFSNEEIDSLYNWSLRGGKVIVASQGSDSTTTGYDGDILNARYGYSYHLNNPSPIIPNANGNATDIFNGPFGLVAGATQGGTMQGFFYSLPPNSQVFATDGSGNATMFMDCPTLDLFIADADVFTNLGGITPGAAITSTQDKLLGNIFVFMDKLQPPPIISNHNDTLQLNTTYNNYQWLLNNNPITGEILPKCPTPNDGDYSVEVTVNGGCKIKSNVIKIDNSEKDTLIISNVFTPDNNGVNDLWVPKKNVNMIIDKITIFNRWGNVIKDENLPGTLWDGKINNVVAADGNYYWILNYHGRSGEKKSMKGYLELISKAK